jgi:hypothetical protein
LTQRNLRNDYNDENRFVLGPAAPQADVVIDEQVVIADSFNYTWLRELCR